MAVLHGGGGYRFERRRCAVDTTDDACRHKVVGRAVSSSLVSRVFNPCLPQKKHGLKSRDTKERTPVGQCRYNSVYFRADPRAFSTGYFFLFSSTFRANASPRSIFRSCAISSTHPSTSASSSSTRVRFSVRNRSSS